MGKSTAQGAPTPESHPTRAAPVFYIPATTSLSERRPRTLKHGDTFAVFDHCADIISGPGSADGLYHRDTRHLSHCTLVLDGQRPLLLSSTLRSDNATLTCDLTNPDLFENGRLALERGLIHVQRTKFLWQGVCHERLGIQNHSVEATRLHLTLQFAADFADLFEVRGAQRMRRGTLHPPVMHRDHVILRYTGLDGAQRVTTLRFDPEPATLTADQAEFHLNLPPQSGCAIHTEVDFVEVDGAIRPARRFRHAIREARHALRRASSRMAAVASSNEIFNEVCRRTVADLRMLITDTSHGPVPYAGIPWFSAVFGRDALITALEVLWMDPSLAQGVLRFLAAHQARQVIPEAQAEPGKILHEMRLGEMAAVGEVPFRRYYGSVDATPLFVWLAGAYLERTGDLETVRAVWPNVLAALEWIDEYGDADRDGFIEYGTQPSQGGLANQGWKDSRDAIFHADGTLAQAPIALVEVQGYVFAARRAAARIATALGDFSRAAALERQAEALRERFESAFWDEALGTYVLALDAHKRPCRVRSSNAGHALFAGIASPARAAKVAAQLMGRNFYCGWGIRTIAAGEARYNPMSYHNGSVWPHDNALIALGLARYNLKAEAVRIFDSLFAAATSMDLRRLPELYCGFPRRPVRGPTLYPVACSPQAWASAAPMALLGACLGIAFDPARGTVRFEGATMPEWLSTVTLQGLELKGARVDVRFTNNSGQFAFSVLRREGSVAVVDIT